VKRFILTKEPDPQGRVRLSGEDYHYLVRVRRLAPGEIFPARLPGGGETLVRVCSVEGGVLMGDCAAPAPDARRGSLAPGKGGEKPCAGEGPGLPPVILFQALPKAGKMDLIVRQAAEGGIAEILPFFSEYSIPRLDKDGSGGPKRLDRWERIVREARQQSGSSTATAVLPPQSEEGLFAHWENLKNQYPGALGLLFHQIPLEQASLHRYLSIDPEIVVLAIGPEGGFSSGEVSRFLSAGFKPLTLGNTVLRTETAALYGAAAIRIILLEKSSWLPKIPPYGNG
jgi:16S rRNA (uracil1498-N3)-methyltransferase